MVFWTCFLAAIALLCWAAWILDIFNDDTKVSVIIGVVAFHFFTALAARNLANRYALSLQTRILILAASCVLLYLVPLVIYLAHEGKFTDWYYGAVVGIGRQRSLYRVIVSQNYVPRNSRRKAMEKLLREDLLAKLAEADVEADYRLQAMKKLQDKTLADQFLLRVALSDDDLCLEAAEAITDAALAQEAYAAIALNEKARWTMGHWRTRYVAAKKLDDAALAQRVYAALAHYNMEALDALTDQDLLFEVAMQPGSTNCRVRAAEMLAGEARQQQAYEATALDSRTRPDEKLKIAEKITNTQVTQRLCREIASDKKCANSTVRLQAIQLLSSPAEAQEAACNFLKSDTWKEGVALFALVTDETVLQDLAVHGSTDEIRKTAVERVTEQTVLLAIAWGEAEISCKLLAIKKIADQAELLAIAEGDAPPACRRAAADILSDSAQQERVYFGLIPDNPDLCKRFGGHFLANQGEECTNSGGGQDVYYNTSGFWTYEYKCVCRVCGGEEYYPSYSGSEENGAVWESEHSDPPVLPDYSKVPQDMPLAKRFAALLAMKNGLGPEYTHAPEAACPKCGKHSVFHYEKSWEEAENWLTDICFSETVVRCAECDYKREQSFHGVTDKASGESGGNVLEFDAKNACFIQLA